MLMKILFLAFFSSIDSLGIGITYGLENTKISYIASVLLFFISFFTTFIAIWFGNILINIYSDIVTSFLGSLILTCMGCFIIFQAINKDTKDFKENYIKNNNINKLNNEKIHTLFLKSFGITIKIIKNPIFSDLDNSKKIDAKESIFLGIALSLDAFCIGIGGSILGINSILFPITVSCMQLFFLKLGNYIGHKLNTLLNLPQNIWSILSGIILILIGLTKFP